MDAKGLRPALTLVAAAALFGILTDLLLTDTAWGINVGVWSFFALFTFHHALKLRDGKGLRPHWTLACLVLLFGGLFSWRDSPTLKVLDGIALFTLLALLAARIRYEWSAWQPFSEYAARLGRVLIAALRGAEPIMRSDVDLKELAQGESANAFRAVGRGLLIALPLLTLFTILLASADARFEHLLTSSIRFDGATVITHLLVILGVAWLAAGYLRDVSQKGSVSLGPCRYPLALGIVEIAIVLGSLDLLFATFVMLQIPYLFGGAGHVLGRAGITYAEYARRGFFELVLVSALALPLMLHAHAMLRAAGKGGEKLFRLLAGVMTGLLFVIMASAIQRMQLYQEQYGLTELRFYTTAFMGWLALVCVWFVPTVLGGLRNRFTFGALLAAMVMIFGLHVVNPDAHIVRTNIARAAEGKPFDTGYNGYLSLDSIPDLVAGLPSLNSTANLELNRILRRRISGRSSDWRGWSLARSSAWNSLSTMPPIEYVDPLLEPHQIAPLMNPSIPVISVPFTPADREKLEFEPLAGAAGRAAPESVQEPAPTLSGGKGIE